jgi:ribosomal protein S27E
MEEKQTQLFCPQCTNSFIQILFLSNSNKCSKLTCLCQNCGKILTLTFGGKIQESINKPSTKSYVG